MSRNLKALILFILIVIVLNSAAIYGMEKKLNVLEENQVKTNQELKELEEQTKSNYLELKEEVEETDSEEIESTEETSKLTYQTVNMSPEDYKGEDKQINEKCVNISCVFVAPDDENFNQFDEVVIDGENYTVMEKTSNCNRYYNDNGTYSRDTNCIEFWDNDAYNKTEVVI